MTLDKSERLEIDKMNVMEKMQYEFRKAAEYLKYIESEVVIKATRRAIQRAVKTGSKTVSKAVRDDGYKVKSGIVKEQIITKLQVKAKLLDELSGEFSIPHVPMSLGYFAPRRVFIKTKTKAGKEVIRVGYTVRVKEKRKLVKGGFPIRSKNGKHLYQRTTDARTPFRKLFTTSVRDVVSNEPVMKFVYEESVRSFEKAFNDSLNYLLKKER